MSMITIKVCYDDSHQPFKAKDESSIDKIHNIDIHKPAAKVLRAILRGRLESSSVHLVNEWQNYSFHRCHSNHCQIDLDSLPLDLNLSMDQLHVRDGDCFFVRKVDEGE